MPDEHKINSSALILLEIEHTRLGQILSAMEAQLDAMDTNGRLETELLGQALTYLMEYPDTCHHPKEDLIAARVQALAPTSQTGIDLQGDHQTLHDLTARAAAQFAARDDDAALAEVLSELTTVYRDHIQFENTTFFPLALHTLSQEDFDRIDFDLFDASDPVFDKQAEARFAALRKELLDRAQPDNPAH